MILYVIAARLGLGPVAKRQRVGSACRSRDPARRGNDTAGCTRSHANWSRTASSGEQVDATHSLATTVAEQLADCRVLPEAVGLRAQFARARAGARIAFRSTTSVQTTALGALEHRPHWRPGEGEFVLRFGQTSEEPAVRAAAAYALAGAATPELVAGVASFLRDSAPEVRLAAAEALMWEAEARWPFARDGVREALADQKLSHEGALFAGIGRLPAAAVADMTTWSAEHPPLAHRAILSPSSTITPIWSGERPELASELSTMMLEAETPPASRGLGATTRSSHCSPDLLDRLTNLDQPGPMRLFAAELMLRINPHDPTASTSRGLARQPNREMAVQIASVLQNVLSSTRLPEGDLPPSTSKEAADISRRVLSWASGADPDVLRPTPGPRPGLKGVSHRSLPAIGSPRTSPCFLRLPERLHCL